MKKYISIFTTFLLTHLAINAQQANFFLSTIDTVFSGLSYDSIPTGILIEKAITGKGTTYYGTENDSTSDFNVFYGLYKAIKDGSNNRASYWDYNDFKQAIDYASAENAIPIFILNYDYNTLKPYFIDSNLIDTIGGRLYDVVGRVESPYVTRKLFSATTSRSYGASDSIRFICNQENYFSNDTSTIATIEINFDDGLGYRIISLNEPIDIHYISDGEKLIQYRITLTNSMVLKAHSTFQLKTEWEFELDEEGFISGTIPYNAEADDSDGLACLRYSITYGRDENDEEHTCLTKPFILLEGFDPGYGPEYFPTAEDPKNGVLGWIDIVTGYRHYLPDPANPDVTLNGEFTPQFNKGPEFAEMLWSNGYDIIYVDFCDGTEYIQRNAFAFVELLNWIINEKKCSEEEMVVVGASMGGQIARYALCYMEQNKIPHCTGLFIPFDSPAKGANFPLGIQGLVYFLNNVIGLPSTEFQVDLVKTPASQQLLIANYFINEAETGYSILRDQLYNEIESMGSYPSLPKKIAVSNGNKNAIPPDGSAESDIFLEITGFGTLPLPIDFGVIPLSLYLETISAFLPGAPLLFGPYDLLFYGNANIALGPILVDSYDGLAIVTPEEPYPHYDTAPGSIREDIGSFGNIELPGLVDFLDHLWLFELDIDVYNEAFTFVPTISALDIYGTEDLYYLVDDIPAVGEYTSLYPFEGYYAPEESGEQHVQLTDGNIAWLEEQLLKVESDLNSILPVIIDGNIKTNYNYGNINKRILRSVNINDDGVLQVNGNYSTSYGLLPGEDIIPNEGSTFTVKTSGCSAIINVNDGGTFEIGDDNTPTNNKGIVELLSGSEVFVNSGGLLKIHKNSKLYIRDGAMVTIEAGSTLQVEDYGEIIVDAGGQLFIKGNAINLAGANAKLTLMGDGKIIIEDEMDFTFTGTGYFNYYDDGIIWLGDNSKFILQGTGSTDRKMKLNTNALLHITSHDVEINDCKIEYASGSSFKNSWNYVTFDYVNCVDLSAGSAAHAIEGDDINDLLVNQSTFDGFSSAIKIDDVTTCPGEINININYSTFTNHTFVAIEANNVERMRLNTSTLIGKDATVQAGLFLEDIEFCELHNSTVKQYTMNNTDAAGIFAKNVDELSLDGAVVRNCHDGIESRNTNIFVRSGGVIKLNTNGINFLSALEVGGTPSELNRLVVGDIGCGWIIQNDYGVIGEDVFLDIDQQIHANASENAFLIYPNRFDGNTVKVFQICYTHYTGASIVTPIAASHCYWTGGTAPAASTYKIGFSADPQCDDISLITPSYYPTQPTTCDCIGEECNTNPTDENIQARLGSTSCNYTIPKQGGGTITIANQYRDAYMYFANHQYNYAYAKFNWLNNKVNAQYGSSGLPNGICRQLHQSSARLLPICDALATSFCLYPFWIDEKSDESIVETLNLYEIHPNPANTFITFSSINVLNSNYKIFAPNGSIVGEGNFESSATIDVSKYARGIYLVQFYNLQNELLETLKFVLQ